MDILLVNPPSKYLRKDNIAPPLGLAYLAAALERNNISTEILDLNLYSDIATKFLQVLKKGEYDLVGFTSVTANSSTVLKLAEIAKKYHADVITVYGGFHATFDYVNILKHCPYIDFIILYEGENVLVELINALKYNRKLTLVSNIAYRGQDSNVRVNMHSSMSTRHLDELPLPARHLLSLDKYKTEGVMAGTILTSRGCPYSCIFCASANFCRHKIKYHSVHRVMSEIEILVNEYKVNEITFVDDTFTIDKRRVVKLCKEIRKEGFDISWGCNTRIDHMDRELVHEMVKSGYQAVFFGIESVTQKVLDAAKKGFTLNQAKKAIKLVAEAGIQPQLSFIIGLPKETKRSALNVLNFLRKVPWHVVSLHVITPYPGTEIFINRKRYGIRLLTTDWDLFDSTTPVAETEDMSVKEITYVLLKIYDELPRIKGVDRQNAESILSLMFKPTENP